MEWLVASAVSCFQVVFAQGEVNIALFAQIKVEAVLTFVPYPNDRHSLTAMALDVFSDGLPWFYNQLNMMRLVIVASYLELFDVQRPCKVAILAHAKMWTICTNEACTDDRSHVTVDALVVVMS